MNWKTSPRAKEAFMAGYRAGCDAMKKEMLGYIYDLGPEARRKFMEQHATDKDGRFIWGDLVPEEHRHLVDEYNAAVEAAL